jgi:hypothetical protein
MMRFKLYDPGDRTSHTLAENDQDSLPTIGEVFVDDGYPLRCMAHVPIDEAEGPFPGVVVGEPPEEMLRSLLKPGTEDVAKASYAFSVSIFPEAPKWENASPLQRRKFRSVAEVLRADLPGSGTD